MVGGLGDSGGDGRWSLGWEKSVCPPRRRRMAQTSLSGSSSGPGDRCSVAGSVPGLGSVGPRRVSRTRVFIFLYVLCASHALSFGSLVNQLLARARTFLVFLTCPSASPRSPILFIILSISNFTRSSWISLTAVPSLFPIVSTSSVLSVQWRVRCACSLDNRGPWGP